MSEIRFALVVAVAVMVSAGCREDESSLGDECLAHEECDYGQICSGRCSDAGVCVDDAVAKQWPLLCFDDDNDGAWVGCECMPGMWADCDDSNDEVSPRAEEVCDGVDNNCDGRTDEGCTADLP